jgi:hypothetical protein
MPLDPPSFSGAGYVVSAIRNDLFVSSSLYF